MYRRNLICLLHDGKRYLAQTPSGSWLAFDDISWAIWEELEYAGRLEDVAARLAARFAVDVELCLSDTREFVASLQRAGLVEAIAAEFVDANRNRYLGLLKRSLVNLIYPEDTLRIRVLARGEAPEGADRKRFLRDIAEHQPERMAETMVSRRLGVAHGLYSMSLPYTLVGMQRLEQLERYAETIFREGIPGDFLEAGVCRGGASIFMRALQVSYGEAHRVMWIADSFQGLPPSTAEPDLAIDLSDVPELEATLPQVQANFARFGLLDGNVRALQGWFADTLPSAPVQQIALLRLDGDLYSSTMETLDALFSRVVSGGYVVVDDYHALPMCRQAVDEFRERLGITAPLQQVDQYCVAWRVPQ